MLKYFRINRKKLQGCVKNVLFKTVRLIYRKPMLFLLFALQLIWASSYVAMKFALAEMPLGLILILRYGIATFLFLVLGCFRFRNKFSLREWILLLLVGILNFSGSPYFQLKALTMTQATDTAILIAFEPLITALLAILFLKEALKLSTFLTLIIATLGVLIMTGFTATQESALHMTRLLGNLCFLFSLVCEATSTITSRHLTQKHNPFQLIAWMTLAGFIGNCIGNAKFLNLHPLQSISGAGWLATIYLGLFCSAIGYGGWTFLVKKIPVNQLSLSLFLQPVLGSLIAALVLNEKMDLQTALGGGMIVTALFVWMAMHLKFYTLGAFKSKTGIST